MGKAKKRSFHLGINKQISNLSREDAIAEVITLLKKNNTNIEEVYGLITLFGLSAEELLENGLTYETVMSLRGIIKE